MREFTENFAMRKSIQEEFGGCCSTSFTATSHSPTDERNTAPEGQTCLVSLYVKLRTANTLNAVLLEYSRERNMEYHERVG